MVYLVKKQGGSTSSSRFISAHSALRALDAYLADNSYPISLYNKVGFEIENIKSRHTFTYTVEPHVIFNITSGGSYEGVV